MDLRTRFVSAALVALSTAACATGGQMPPTTELPTSADAMGTNPLLADWSGPYGGVPPWDRVRPEDFPEAFATAIDVRRAEIAAIAGNPAPPSFDNTFAPLQDSGRDLRRVGARP